MYRSCDAVNVLTETAHIDDKASFEVTEDLQRALKTDIEGLCLLDMVAYTNLYGAKLRNTRSVLLDSLPPTMKQLFSLQFVTEKLHAIMALMRKDWPATIK